MPTATRGDDTQAKNATVKLSVTEREGIKTIATLRNRTPHYIMREAIQKYLATAASEQLLIQAALRSREHLRETGLHVTQDEFITWVDAIQQHPKTPMPICHV